MGYVAVFGVDPQNDFGHPNGTLYCPGGFKVVGGGMILTQHAQENDSLVFFSGDCHPEDSDHFKPKGPWPPHCIRGTWGSRFLTGVQIPSASYTFLKGTKKHEDGYDPFDGKTSKCLTPEEVLEAYRIDTIVVWGIATNYCVRAFVLTARQKGYKVYIALDACAAVPTPENPDKDFITEEQAIKEMRDAGAIMTTVSEVVSGKI